MIIKSAWCRRARFTGQAPAGLEPPIATQQIASDEAAQDLQDIAPAAGEAAIIPTFQIFDVEIVKN